MLAVGLSTIPRPVELALGKPSFPDLSSIPDEFWISGQIPELSSFLGPESWLLFNKLDLSDSDMEWLELDPDEWELATGYRRFRDFVRNLTIVNDPAERGVGLVKQYIASFQNEASCQDNLLVVAKHRNTVKKNSKKCDLAKVGLN